MKGKSCRGNRICFGRYALQVLEPAWITARQIEAGRRAMTRYARRGGKLWVRIFPDKPVTLRPTETRMGSGKGSPEYWVAVVKPGRILYEMSGVSETVARGAIFICAVDISNPIYCCQNSTLYVLSYGLIITPTFLVVDKSSVFIQE